jgi:antitoxin component of MazEF toxin-antitoxin module
VSTRKNLELHRKMSVNVEAKTESTLLVRPSERRQMDTQYSDVCSENFYITADQLTYIIYALES